MMPKLSKAAGNQKNHRISIPDEIIAWCGWESEAYVDIVRCEEPIKEYRKSENSNDTKLEVVSGVKRYLKLEIMDVDDAALEKIWLFAIGKAQARKQARDGKGKK